MKTEAKNQKYALLLIAKVVNSSCLLIYTSVFRMNFMFKPPWYSEAWFLDTHSRRWLSTALFVPCPQTPSPHSLADTKRIPYLANSEASIPSSSKGYNFESLFSAKDSYRCIN